MQKVLHKADRRAFARGDRNDEITPNEVSVILVRVSGAFFME
jgi:hypothetical protein